MRFCTVIVLLFSQVVAVAATPTVQMGWLKVYSSSIFDTSIRTPIPDAENPGQLVDINAWPIDQPLPLRFLIGDGSIRRAVLAIDQTPGSPLDLALNTVLPELQSVARLNVLRDRLEKLLKVKWSLGKDEVGDNSWDPPAPVATTLEKNQASRLGELTVGGLPEPSDRRLPIVALEKFLEHPSSAYCIQKALLVRLLLERLKIPSRYVAGAKLVFYRGEKIPRSLGHSWVSLEDGTILDATTHASGPKGEAHPSSGDWFSFNREYRLEDTYYPMLILD